MNIQDKFKRDEKQLARAMRFLLAVDQLFNVLLWNGSQDQTISGHIAVRKAEGRANWFDNAVCCVLRKLESKHCIKAIDE